MDYYELTMANGYFETGHKDTIAVFDMFYRKNPADKDVLIKVLLNENEATLPLQTDVAPYYHWNDFRNYYLQRINNYKE